MFQSHNGAIAAVLAEAIGKLVQVFQSHNGAIAATACKRSGGEQNKFQSHNGAIAAFASPSLRFGFCYVSIPQWCDCCEFGAPLSLMANAVSIPQWCDCCQCRV